MGHEVLPPHTNPGAYFQTDDVLQQAGNQIRLNGVLKLRASGTYRVVFGWISKDGRFYRSASNTITVTGEAGDQVPIQTGRVHWHIWMWSAGVTYGVFGDGDSIPLK